jgi:hypothetical protein
MGWGYEVELRLQLAGQFIQRNDWAKAVRWSLPSMLEEHRMDKRKLDWRQT